ncbi:MAG: DUF1552 domain-containing protein [Vicinamibacterales bacterium]
MFITKKSLSRRTFLRGMGVTVALPWLDAMMPALATPVTAAALAPTRYGFLYVPHGVILDRFLPSTVGADFELLQILKPLEPLKRQLTLVSNLTGPPDNGSGHVGAASSWLTGTSAKRTEAEDVRVGTTVDQLIAKQVGQDTLFPSLELATEDLTGLIGSCDYGFSCTYLNTLCWSSPTTPLPMEVNPRVVFERMFGDATSRERHLAHMREDRSILDSVRQDATRLSQGLGADDRHRVNDFLDNVREIERRLQAAERQAQTSVIRQPQTPIGVPELYDDHVALLFDLMALAYQADITRVSTLMFGRELTNRTYPQAGVPEPHHAVSHHQNNPEMIEKHAKINTYHMTLFATLMEKLRQTPDGDGSLLDHTILHYGSGMANGNVHSHNPLWMLMAGGGNGLPGNRHIKAADGTPLGNLLVGIAARAGIGAPRIGLSNGMVEV